ncbi:MAG: DNA-formamidopyrimidine glycosylase family protein [Planctomycetota bacterium]
MPELPDVVLYVESLGRLLGGSRVEKVRVRSPFVLRTFTPDIDDLAGCSLAGFDRRGKRIVWWTESGPHLVIHPMIAGRFHWKKAGYAARGKNDLIAFDFADGCLMLTEASKKKRAGVWVCATKADVDGHDPGGLDVLHCDVGQFTNQLRAENRTLKRALTSPRRFDGIGNAYSDEILHAAKLSPLRRTDQLSDEELHRLFECTRSTLQLWIDRLREQTGDKFPEKVTAFRTEMAVHGKYNQPCPVCDAPVQRIRYADNECNYCARCQTGGKLLSDRSLARLMKDDWPKTIDELEENG